MPCRTYWTLVALSVAIGCVIVLAVANEALRRLDAERENRRKALAEERMSRDMKAESDWLIRDTAEHGLVFERDGGEMVWSVN